MKTGQGGDWRTLSVSPRGPDLEKNVASSRSHQVGKPRRRSRFKTLMWTGLLGAVALVGGLVVGVADDHGAGVSDRFRSALNNTLISTGFGVDQVTLVGHRIASDREIFDALDLNDAQTFFTLDVASARARVENISWVARAEILRVYPGQIAVKIKERRPFAVWTRGEEKFLVDAEGRILSAVDAGFSGGLTQLVGSGAPKNAAALFQLLDRHPDLRSQLSVAEFVSGRRWQLHLDSGAALQLPANGAAMALQDLAKSGELTSLLDKPARIIDLRSRGRITVRPAA